MIFKDVFVSLIKSASKITIVFVMLMPLRCHFTNISSHFYLIFAAVETKLKNLLQVIFQKITALHRSSLEKGEGDRKSNDISTVPRKAHQKV